ncbi:Fe-S cluster assembly protein SufD [Lichenihabitans sp. PAMC28606]|uniref:Fe-S cluster assembly protein SufD n=1 Tax=Lichenihabitans sp. PAMC28606 TaxID=2880932 RepID=UPI001D0A479E|nr:Fe-S cluster assembly protein SufD [Lichenihabitans sp. PAMC28606]UDL95279.1 Fe-S cluster assembly protein SufD [Lichenihabitans sp. PAMC28606]
MSAEITLMKTPAETRLGDYFEAMRATADRADLAAYRADAFARFAAKGLPHRRIEAWHYTDLRSMLREAFAPAHPADDAGVAAAKAHVAGMADPVGPRAVLLDGVYRPDLSSVATLSAGVTLVSVLDRLANGALGDALSAAEALGTPEAILALNAALMQGGVALTVSPGVSVVEPIELVFLATAGVQASISTRSLVEVGAGASLTLIERHVALGEADNQGNHALIVALGDEAAIDHVARMDGFSKSSVQLGTVLARIGSKARFASFTLMTLPGVTRRQSFLEFAGTHSAADFKGVSLLDGRSHADTTLIVTHTAAHCESREYYKTILDGESTGVYQGRVVVAPGAQKTDGKMLSKAIFLADGASMFNKPELEIFADDVVCGHGATVGNLDENQLFYLRARGIPRKDAETLLLNAFAADAIDGVATEELRQELTGSVEQWLHNRES